MIDEGLRTVVTTRPLLDAFARPLRDLRLSVIDQCNLRCLYCMPEDHYAWLPKRDLLTVDEISRLVDVFVSVGVTKVRLTGGEPLIRRDLMDIVRAIAAKRVDDFAITTNGVLLAGRAAELKRAGLGRVTVSLDTLRQERFAALSQRGNHQAVLDGIESLEPAGFSGTKLDTVVIRGVNDDELVDLIEFARTVQAEVRFIEYMDVGGATRWSREDVVGKAEMLERIAGHYGRVTSLPRTDSAPATRFVLPDGSTFGIVSSTTEPFCATCDRSRLTADGIWLGCLYAFGGINLRDPLRSGATDADLAEIIGTAWSKRDDRGAEDRLAQQQRGVFIPLERLQLDPHLEMHTRGG